MLRGTILALLLGVRASATYLYASSYSGLVTTLNLTGGALDVVSSTDECGTSPSWLTVSATDGVLYCSDEGFGTWPDGTVASFSTSDDGSLVLLDTQVTTVGGVSAHLYGDGDSRLAVAYYAGSALGTYDTTAPENISLLELEALELEQPGTVPDRQDAAHPHQIIVDPTGAFVLAPDLGADIVRIYAVSETDQMLTPVESLAVPAGSGPRHGAFAVYGDVTYFYLVTELGNTILGYNVLYDGDALSFEQIYESGTHGEGNEVPELAAAAELLITPDQNFLIVSSRYEDAFEIPNFDPDNSTDIVSDTLINFSIDTSTGLLTQIQAAPAGGRMPRQFSINTEGDLVAVGLQEDGRVVVIERDTETGLLGGFVAAVPVEGEVTCVIFNDLI